MVIITFFCNHRIIDLNRLLQDLELFFIYTSSEAQKITNVHFIIAYWLLKINLIAS